MRVYSAIDDSRIFLLPDEDVLHLIEECLRFHDVFDVNIHKSCLKHAIACDKERRLLITLTERSSFRN